MSDHNDEEDEEDGILVCLADRPCGICGHEEIAWIDCPECDGDEEDDNELDEVLCDECNGDCGWWECFGCGVKAIVDDEE